MEDAAKRIHHCMSTVCKHLLCTTDMDVKTVASAFQSLLGLWAKYKKAKLPGWYTCIIAFQLNICQRVAVALEFQHLLCIQRTDCFSSYCQNDGNFLTIHGIGWVGG